MPASLVQGRACPDDLLTLFAVRDGRLVALDAPPTFAIVDVSAGLPGTAVVSGTGVEVRPGCYRPAAGGGGAWTPGTAIARGEIRWSFNLDGAREIIREFEVLANSVSPRPREALALVADLRDAGLPRARVSDKAAADCLALWRDLIERTGRQRFRAVFERKGVQGSGSQSLYLSEAIVALSRITMNGAALPTVSTWFDVSTNPADPRITIASANATTIFSPSVAVAGVFAPQHRQGVEAVWGRVDPETFETPAIIRRAAVKGVLRTYEAAIPGGLPPAMGWAKSETTDGHSIEYAIATGSIKGGLLPILRDPEIRDAIMLHRAPLAIAGGVTGEW